MPGRASWLCTDPILMILPLPPLDHAAGHALADQERAGQVGGNEVIPVLQRELGERGTALDARVVDQDVRRSPLLLDVGDSAVDGVLIGDVERADRGLAPGLLGQIQRRCLDLVDVAAVDGDPAARLEQALGEG